MFPNWFEPYAEGFFTRHLKPLAGQPGLRFMQIGAFTGDATVWMVENVLTGNGSWLVDVDTWEGSDEPEHEAIDFADVEDTYDKRTEPYCSRIQKIKGDSTAFLRGETSMYDFIYVDGDHTAPGVLSDAVHALPLLKRGGFIAFDDYLWQSHDGDRLHSPAVAVDAFRTVYAEQVKIVDLGAQAWFRRIK